MQRPWKTVLIESKQDRYHSNQVTQAPFPGLLTPAFVACSKNGVRRLGYNTWTAVIISYCSVLVKVTAYVNPSSWALGAGPLDSVWDFKRTGMKPKTEWECQVWHGSQTMNKRFLQQLFLIMCPFASKFIITA